jgi:hypothetical protein
MSSMVSSAGRIATLCVTARGDVIASFIQRCQIRSCRCPVRTQPFGGVTRQKNKLDAALVGQIPKGQTLTVSQGPAPHLRRGIDIPFLPHRENIIFYKFSGLDTDHFAHGLDVV